jgi:phosphoribosylformylglycinamidine synthase
VIIFDEDLTALRAIWSDVTRRIAALRDNPACAERNTSSSSMRTIPASRPKLTFAVRNLNKISDFKSADCGDWRSHPRVAILREQGVNGQVEMAAAFTRAGFRASTCT